MKNPKRPRHWAAEIAALPTRLERNEKLNQAPEEWRELIKKHVEITFFVMANENTTIDGE